MKASATQKSGQKSGYATLIAALFLVLLLILSLTFLDFIYGARTQASQIINGVNARFIAEAGLDKALWSLNDNFNYSGEAATNFGGGQYTVVVTGIDAINKKLTITAAVPSFSAFRKATAKLSAIAAINGNIIAFSCTRRANGTGMSARTL